MSPAGSVDQNLIGRAFVRFVGPSSCAADGLVSRPFPSNPVIRLMSFSVKSILLTLSCCLVAGCASTKVTLPPRSLAIAPQGQRVALIGINGQPDLADAARTCLAEKINQSGAYQVVEAPATVMTGQPVSSAPLPVKLQQGRMLGAELLLQGHVKSALDNNSLGGSIAFGDPTLNVTLTVELIDVETGATIAREAVTKSLQGEFERNSKSSNSVGSVSARLAQQCAEVIVERLTMSNQPVEVELASSTFHKGSGKLKEGIEAAQSADWSTAEAHFLRALADDPGNHEALYNLGVVNEALGNNAEALKYYNAAAKKKDSQQYRDAANRAKNRERETLLAWTKAQRAAQPVVQQLPPPQGPNAGPQQFAQWPAYQSQYAAPEIRRLPQAF